MQVARQVKMYFQRVALQLWRIRRRLPLCWNQDILAARSQHVHISIPKTVKLLLLSTKSPLTRGCCAATLRYFARMDLALGPGPDIREPTARTKHAPLGWGWSSWLFLVEDGMYAVVKAGGRQIKVTYGEEVRIDRVQGDPGASYRFDKVLMVGGDGVKVGRPYLEGVAIDAEIVEHGKAPKVIAFKKRRRKNYRRKVGFRAQYTIVRIGEISGIDGPWVPPVAEERQETAAETATAADATPVEAAPEE